MSASFTASRGIAFAKHPRSVRIARVASPAVAGPSRLPTQPRFQSTSSTPSTPFEPALPSGENPAYDAALSYLSSYSSHTSSRIQTLRSRLASTDLDPAVRSKLESRVAKLELERGLNDPATRRLFVETRGKGNMEQAVMRSLAKKEWTREGGLDLLMQRVLQLDVVPDLVGEIHPPALNRLTLGTTSGSVEPGSFQLPSSFSSPPSLTLQLFDHPTTPSTDSNAEGKFTLLVIDPDYPEHETSSYSQRLHYCKTDIPLSVVSGETDLFSAAGNEVLSWEPPAPAKGTGRHRYVFVVINLSSSTSTSSPLARENFDLRAYLSSLSLSSAAISGLTLFRAQYTVAEHEFINSVFLTRGVQGGVPEYGKAPKEMKYGYPMSAKQVRAEDIRQVAWDGLVAEIEEMQKGKVPTA